MSPTRLADYAVGNSDAARKYSEPEPPRRQRDWPYRQDRDRILRCSAFRRLDFKTQVFVPHEHDHFRTRLTHSLEVAQVGRNIGRELRLNEDLIEAAALAHDLGHPPFGHGGEKALDEKMAACGGFEHNRQSLRVVDYLEHPYPLFRGLNLVRATRQCLAKHQTRYDTPACEDFPAGTLAPLEGQLVDLADEIAYTTADLEDALAAEWITEEQLSELALWRQAKELAARTYPQARAIHHRIAAVRNVLEMLSSDLTATTGENIKNKKMKIDSPATACAAAKCATLSPQTAGQLEQLQQFLMERVYRHPVNLAQEDRGRGILCELFDAFVANPNRLPGRYEKRIDTDGRYRVVCDYIAGMTDRFCREQHALLCTTNV